LTGDAGAVIVGIEERLLKTCVIRAVSLAGERRSLFGQVFLSIGLS
jgi:hypothetical protein